MRRWIYLLLTIFCFSLIGLFRKASLDWPSTLLAFFRLAGAAFLIGLFVIRRPPSLPTTFRLWAEWMLAGLLLAASFTLYLESFRYAPISSVSIVGFIDPFLVLVLSGLLISERVTRWSYAAAALAAAGLFTLGFSPTPGLQMQGLILDALSMVCGAFFVMLVRRTQREGPLSQALFYPFAFGAFLLFLYTIAGVFLSGSAELTALRSLSAVGFPGWQAVAGLMGATALGYWAYENLMMRWGAHLTDLSVRVGISAFSALLGVFFLGELLGGGWWLAAVFLFGSAAMLYYESVQLRRPYKPRPHGHTL